MSYNFIYSAFIIMYSFTSWLLTKFLFPRNNLFNLSMRIKLFLHVFILEFTQTRFKKKTRNNGLWNFYLYLNFNFIGTLKLNIFYFQLPKSGEESSKRSQDSLLDGQPKSLVLHKRSLAESTANDWRHKSAWPEPERH